MMIESFLFISILFFLSVVCHEYAHGWTAFRLGDPTAKNFGRLTLNPFKHIDVFGTILLPMGLVLMRSPIIFGWAKPVPVNFLRLRNPKKDMIWVGLSGPAANFLLAFFFSRLILKPFPSQWIYIFEMMVLVNLVLAFFNLIPIPPLDGSRVLMGLLPEKLAFLYSKIERYGIPVVFLLLYLGLLANVIWPLVKHVSTFLGVRL